MSDAREEARATRVARGAPGWIVPSGRPPFVLGFSPGRAEIDAAIVGAIDSAVASYRRTGFAWLRFADPAEASGRIRPALTHMRALRVRGYLDARGIWSVPLRRQGGRWVATSWGEAGRGALAGVALMGVKAMAGGDDEDPLEVPPVPPSPVPPEPSPVPPEPSPVPSLPKGPGARPQLVPRSNAVRPSTPIKATGAPSDGLPAVSSWLTPTGTLTSRALQTLIGHCLSLEGELSAECQGAVAALEGPFASVPRDARSEFSLLLTGCRTLRQGRTCAQGMAMEREFRALPRGRLDPHPLTMEEDSRTTFIARIIYEGDLTGGGQPGVPIGDTRPPGKGGSSQSTVVPFSGRMCFSLTADAKDFRIRRLGEACPEINEASSRVRYDPQWEVTPLRAGKLELKLKTELYVGEEKKEFRHEPYPLIIDVTPKRSLWDKLDATIKRLTGTLNLAVGLVEAIGLLIAAVGGLSIWGWFRKRKRKRRKAPPAG